MNTRTISKALLSFSLIFMLVEVTPAIAGEGTKANQHEMMAKHHNMAAMHHEMAIASHKTAAKANKSAAQHHKAAAEAFAKGNKSKGLEYINLAKKSWTTAYKAARGSHRTF